MSAVVFQKILNAVATTMLNEHLLSVAKCLGIANTFQPQNLQRDIKRTLKLYATRMAPISNITHPVAQDVLNSIGSLPKPLLVSLVSLHQVQFPSQCCKANLRNLIVDHILHGKCIHPNDVRAPQGCAHVMDELKDQDMGSAVNDLASNDMEILLLSALVKNAK